MPVPRLVRAARARAGTAPLDLSQRDARCRYICLKLALNGAREAQGFACPSSRSAVWPLALLTRPAQCSVHIRWDRRRIAAERITSLARQGGPATVRVADELATAAARGRSFRGSL